MMYSTLITRDKDFKDNKDLITEGNQYNNRGDKDFKENKISLLLV